MVIEKYGMCPCDSGWISQGYKSKHKAIDIGWLDTYGDKLPVKAWKSGKVIATGTDSAGGVYVVLQHDDTDYRWITRYWHFVKGSVKVKKGQTVTQGQVLGTRGKSGISTGVHLHFEVLRCPKNYTYKSSTCSQYAVNPLNYTYLFDGQVMKGNTILPKKPQEVEIVKPQPVDANTRKWQVEVIASKLRVRMTPSLDGKVYSYCPKGIYNVMQSKVADNYTWYEIETDRWIATTEGEWTIDKPIIPTAEEIKIANLMKQLSEANAEIKSLQAQLEKIRLTGGWN